MPLNSMEYAPIVLFVYNRPEHTLKTLEALRRNMLANDSILYIYADGPKIDANSVQRNKIETVREVIRKEKWCKEIFIIESQDNLGLANSVIKGVTEIMNKHGNAIVLEDDIITNTFFIEYMNMGLNLYKDSKNVYGISGYNYQVTSSIKEDSYFLPIFCSWGYALWADRWSAINFDGNELLFSIEKASISNKMKFGIYDYFSMLKDQVSGLNDSWAVRFYASMILNNGVILYPKKSLCWNIGFDGTGVHCVADEKMQSQKINLVFRPKLKKIPLIVNEKILAKFNQDFNKEYFLDQLINRVRNSYKVKGLLSLINKLKKILK